VSIFRRREPLHVRLAREGGIVIDEKPAHDTTPRWGEAGIHGVSRPRVWDEVTTVEAEGPAGDTTEFVVLPDGSLVGDDAEVPLADALSLEPPFRVEAVRQAPDLWAVAARRIQVSRFDHGGEEIELTVQEGNRSLVVDGFPEFGGIRELEELLGGADGVVRARRIDGSEWEVQAHRL
jgi:hypothetical protein